jgi:aryl-alcohol dehydrogenase-like predicted oxidoreductase
MEYRRLGNTGLKLSVLSLGSWVTFGDQVDVGLAADCLAAPQLRRVHQAFLWNLR